MLGFHLAVDGVPVELDARRDADLEVHDYVVVLGVRRPVASRRALVVSTSPARRRVDGADGHTVFRLHDLDLDRRGIAAAGVLRGGDFGLASGCDAHRVDVPVHAFDLQPLARGQPAAPVKRALSQRGPDSDGEPGESGERNGAHGQLSSWSSWCLSCSWPGRHSLMSPLNVATDTVTLARSGTASVTSPLCVAKR